MMMMIHVEEEERRVMIPLASFLRDDNGYGYGVDARPYNYQLLRIAHVKISTVVIAAVIEPIFFVC